MSSAISAVSRLSSRVWRILGCNPGPMTLQGTNMYLVGTGTNRVLIDAGQDGFPEYVNNLKKLLSDEKARIDRIILTHWHEDHVGALVDLIPVLQPNLPTVYKFNTEEERDVNIPEGYQLQRLQDEQVIEVEGATLKVFHTPGHTTDHAVLLLKEEEVLFSGDCILGEGTAVFEDLFSYMRSLQRIRSLEPKFIFPAHGPLIEDPVIKIDYYIHHRMEREKQILEFISNADSPVTPLDIVKGVYKETPEALYPAAEYNVSHHLTKLVKENRIIENVGKYSVRLKGKI